MDIKQKTKDLIDCFMNSSCIGIVYAVLSTILFSYAYFAAQQVIHSTTNFPILELVFVRCVVQVILLIPPILIFKKRVLFERGRWLDLLALTVVGYWCLVSGYWALAYIPASILLPISATCPLFALAFSCLILKEKFYISDAICGFLGIIGILIIARPSFLFGKYRMKTKIQLENISEKGNEGSYLIGCFIAILFGAGKALLITLIRKWARDSGKENTDLTPAIMYPSLFGAALTPTLMVFSGKSLILPSTGYAFLLFAASILTLMGSYAISCAMRTQTAPVVGVIRNLDIVWIFLIQYAVNSIWPSVWSVCGAIIIVSATIVACFRDKLFGKTTCCQRGYEKIKSEDSDLEASNCPDEIKEEGVSSSSQDNVEAGL